MTDHLSKEKRSWNMSRIRSKNTKPELALRSLMHQAGYRFRLNGKVAKRLYESGTLSGKPDIVLAKYRTIIFVHGCFWHRHDNCSKATTPKSNTEFWLAKFAKNIERDQKNSSELHRLNWHVIIVWECELKDMGSVMKKISAELSYLPENMAGYSTDPSELIRRVSVQYTQDKTLELPMAAEKKAMYNRKKL